MQDTIHLGCSHSKTVMVIIINVNYNEYNEVDYDKEVDVYPLTVMILVMNEITSEKAMLQLFSSVCHMDNCSSPSYNGDHSCAITSVFQLNQGR